MKWTTTHQRLNTFSAFILVLILSSCSVQLVSDYDEETDKNVTALHEKVETFFVSLEDKTDEPECTYESNKSFYQEVHVATSALEVRAKAIPKNDITLQHIALLDNSFEKLKELHLLGCIGSEQIPLLRSDFNTHFTAILKLELAKKRGE